MPLPAIIVGSLPALKSLINRPQDDPEIGSENSKPANRLFARASSSAGASLRHLLPLQVFTTTTSGISNSFRAGKDGRTSSFAGASQRLPALLQDLSTTISGPSNTFRAGKDGEDFVYLDGMAVAGAIVRTHEVSVHTQESQGARDGSMASSYPQSW